MKKLQFLQRLLPFQPFKKQKTLTRSQTACASIRLYIPNRDKYGRPISQVVHDNWSDYFALQLSEVFGGCFIESVKSYYVNAHQQILEEETYILNASFFGKSFEVRNLDTIISSLKEFGAETLQETILYEYNHKSYLMTI